MLINSSETSLDNETLLAKRGENAGKSMKKTQKFETVTTLSITTMSVDFDAQPQFKYKLQKVKSFKHGMKLTDPDSIRKYNKFKNILQEFKNGTFAPPSDDMVVVINQSLNRLTGNVEMIHKTSEKIIHSYFFGTDKFIDLLSESIVTSVINQTAFVQVYTRFLQEIYIGLPTEEQKSLLMNKISKILFESPEKNIGKSFFIGCLLSAQLIDYKPVFELVKNMLKMEETNVYETLFNLLIFAGPVLDEKCEDFEEEVVNKLVMAACNQDIKQRVRFLLSDLLDAKADNWNVSSLLQNIVQIQETSKIQKQEAEMKKMKKKEKAKQEKKTAVHSFNPQIKDHEKIDSKLNKEINEDEDDEDDIDSNGSLLNSYLKSRSLPKIWNKRCTTNIMTSLIMIEDIPTFNKGVMIFNEPKLKNDKKFLSTCVECLNEAKKKVNHPNIISKYPYCMEIVGSVFAELVRYCDIDPTLLGSPIFPFEISIFIGFVDELKRIDRLDIIEYNEYFTNYLFKPPILPHSQLLYELDAMNLADVFPIYNAMLDLFQMIEEEKPKEDIKKFINNDLDDKIAKSPMFTQFLTEIIVIQRPPKCQCLLDFMARRPMVTLAHIESLGEFYHWKPQQTAAQIRKVSELIHADINKFINMELRPFHKEVVKYLQSE